MSILFKIIRNGRDFSCTADDGSAFFVGRKVPYEDNIGLYNIFAGSRLQKLDFDHTNYVGEYGFWANFINPTAGCEGRNFLTLNTYDRAAFTFGFGQFAAHVADGDFVTYFRALLGRPEAQDYFPSLEIIGGRIHKTDGPGAPVPLESASSTAALMHYLNPSLDDVQDDEVIAAAKLIHWTSTHREARLVQIAQMVETFKSFMTRADNRGLIDGRPAAQCCAIADLLHHGRGGKMVWTLVAEALQSSDPFNRLIAIGAPKWEERKRTLKRLILADPQMQTLHWNRQQAKFM